MSGVGKMGKLLIINGPNLNMLGIREPHIYGDKTYAELVEYIKSSAREYGFEAVCFQSNHEGAIVDEIQRAYGGGFAGLIINPAAYTHTSIAIPDAIKSVGLTAVEVHLSDLSKREGYRQHSYTSEACAVTVMGKGFEGYKEAVRFFVDLKS
jgi:3-dehydroquinate dehydratase-2